MNPTNTHNNSYSTPHPKPVSDEDENYWMAKVTRSLVYSTHSPRHC